MPKTIQQHHLWSRIEHNKSGWILNWIVRAVNPLESRCFTVCDACVCSFSVSNNYASLTSDCVRIYALQLMQINYVTSFKLPKNLLIKEHKTTKENEEKNRGKKNHKTWIAKPNWHCLNWSIGRYISAFKMKRWGWAEIKSLALPFDYKQCVMWDGVRSRCVYGVGCRMRNVTVNSRTSNISHANVSRWGYCVQRSLLSVSGCSIVLDDVRAYGFLCRVFFLYPRKRSGKWKRVITALRKIYMWQLNESECSHNSFCLL